MKLYESQLGNIFADEQKAGDQQLAGMRLRVKQLLSEAEQLEQQANALEANLVIRQQAFNEAADAELPATTEPPKE